MTASVAPAPSMFSVFRKRDFSLLWLAQLVSTAGSALTDLAAGIFVYRQTGSALAVGLTLMATAVPSLLVGLLAGVFVDRHDRKRIMIVTCLIQAATVALIAVVIGIEAIAVVGLYVLILVNAGVRQFFDPAHDSIIPELASDEELAAANSFLSIAAFGSTAIGFAGAGLLATIDLRLAFVIDALTFLFSAACIAGITKVSLPVPEEEASVGVVVANLRSGLSTLFGTPVLRSLFLVGAIMFFSFGLWNVLLLPFAIKVLGATEFEYGIQEAVTSIGFVVGSFFMARFSSRLPEPAWMVIAMVGMGAAGLAYAAAPGIGFAIGMVTISGFFNSPSSVARSVLLQRNTPREMRGRVFSAFYVMRDVIFLFGMAGAGLADILPIRLMIVVASSLLFVAGGAVLVAPGLSLATWRAAAARLRAATEAVGGLSAFPARPATLADFDRLTSRLGTLAALSPEQRDAFIRDARVREVPAGTRIVEHGDTASDAYFLIDGTATAGIPTEDSFRGLSTMGPGDFFGEIAALTGSPRTADVVADSDATLLELPAAALRSTMVVPELQRLVFSTLTTRLTRTQSADLPRLAGVDQESLRDLRTPRPNAEASPRTFSSEGAS
jgi:MFS family permease